MRRVFPVLLIAIVFGVTPVFAQRRPITEKDLFSFVWIGDPQISPDGSRVAFVKVSEPEEIWYTSFDGKRIQTWVQKPPDFDPNKKYPLILNIHGGPHAARLTVTFLCTSSSGNESHELSRSGQPWHRIERLRKQREIRSRSKGKSRARSEKLGQQEEERSARYADD